MDARSCASGAGAGAGAGASAKTEEGAATRPNCVAIPTVMSLTPRLSITPPPTTWHGHKHLFLHPKHRHVLQKRVSRGCATFDEALAHHAASSINSRHVLPLLAHEKGTTPRSQHSMLCLPLCQGGDLFDVLFRRSGAPVPMWHRVEMMKQAAAGLCDLHAGGVAHIDVKLENVYLWTRLQVETRKVPRVVLADFGHAMPQPEEHAGRRRWGRSGTLLYNPPEAFLVAPPCGSCRGTDFFKWDVWQFGIMAFMAWTGSQLLAVEELRQHARDIPHWQQADEALRQRVHARTRCLPLGLRHTVRMCCMPSPSSRATMAQVCAQLRNTCSATGVPHVAAPPTTPTQTRSLCSHQDDDDADAGDRSPSARRKFTRSCPVA